ncbi:MAG: HDOD domain-containing protein [Cycloclasticus sp.]
MDQFSFARQPILDKSLLLYAYEFLYRPTDDALDRNHSITSEVLVSSIVDMGLDKASNNKLAFINMSYQDIMSEHIEALPTDQLILELLEDIKPDQKLVTRVKSLSEQGFRFALDDFVYSSDWDPLIELAEIIKLDLSITSLEENRILINKLKHTNIIFLAEKVESYTDYKAYRDIGCSLFQGYFFSKPEVIKGSSLNASNLSKTKLLSLINQPDISFKELQETIQQDPSLTFLLLKYLNSAKFSFSNPIESIQQAITILGLDNIKRWSTLVTLREMSSKPPELLRLALVRAKLAELLASHNKQLNSNGFFLSGLLSVLDALLDTPLAIILKSMPLDLEISQALLKREGEMGKTLDSIIRHETNPLDTGKELGENYLEACEWADQIMEAL